MVASGELPLCRPDLPARQPAPARAVASRSHQAAAVGALGHDARPQLHLCAHQPRDHRARPQRRVCDRAWPRCSGHPRQHLSRGHVLRGLPAHHAGRGRDEEVLPAVLVSRRHPQPRRARDARLHPRGRRAGVLAEPRVRRRLRQPRADGLLRGRRRRGRDGSAGGELAREQVHQPRTRRLRRARPSPQRLQDRQPHRPRAHST